MPRPKIVYLEQLDCDLCGAVPPFYPSNGTTCVTCLTATGRLLDTVYDEVHGHWERIYNRPVSGIKIECSCISYERSAQIAESLKDSISPYDYESHDTANAARYLAERIAESIRDAARKVPCPHNGPKRTA